MRRSELSALRLVASRALPRAHSRSALSCSPIRRDRGTSSPSTSEQVSVVFLTLAAGSIIYVVMQLIGVAAKARRNDLLAYGLLIGVLAGFITDAIVTAAGV